MLAHPGKTQVRQVAFYRGRADTGEESFTDKMKRAIDRKTAASATASALPRSSRSSATSATTSALDRFTLRRRQKVDAQWKQVLN